MFFEWRGTLKQWSYRMEQWSYRSQRKPEDMESEQYLNGKPLMTWQKRGQRVWLVQSSVGKLCFIFLESGKDSVAGEAVTKGKPEARVSLGPPSPSRNLGFKLEMKTGLERVLRVHVLAVQA